jgi:hypothetical protein
MMEEVVSTSEPTPPCDNTREDQSSPSPSTSGEKRISRKRKRDLETWNKNIRKNCRQGGRSYTSVRGNKIPEKAVKTFKDCSQVCKIKCSCKISNDDRLKTFEAFWSLSDDEKSVYYSETTERHEKARTRTDAAESKREYSYKYFICVNEERIRVCKPYYLGTHSISQSRISYFHGIKKDEITKWGSQGPPFQGKNPNEQERSCARPHQFISSRGVSLLPS